MPAAGPATGVPRPFANALREFQVIQQTCGLLPNDCPLIVSVLRVCSTGVLLTLGDLNASTRQDVSASSPSAPSMMLADVFIDALTG